MWAEGLGFPFLFGCQEAQQFSPLQKDLRILLISLSHSIFFLLGHYILSYIVLILVLMFYLIYRRYFL